MSNADHADDNEVWDMCIRMIAAADPDSNIETKLKAVALHLALVSFSASGFDEIRANKLITDLARSAKEAGKAYGDGFREMYAHMVPDTGTKQ